MDDFNRARLEELLHKKAAVFLRRVKRLRAALSPAHYAVWLVGHRLLTVIRLDMMRAGHRATRKAQRLVEAAVAEALDLDEAGGRRVNQAPYFLLQVFSGHEASRDR